MTRTPSRPVRRLLLLGVPLLLCVLLAAGFARFLDRTQTGGVPPPRADGIVVLTGGADRIATALKLLAEGRGRILLVSGVGGEAEFADLARQAGADPELGSRVTLGRAAASTYGNAQETASWARAHHLGSLIVVTAYYHMPRALAELARALPEVRLLPVAVQPPSLHGAIAWRLLAGEYAKWLAAEAGLSGLAERGQSSPVSSPASASSPASSREQQTESRARPMRLGG